MSLWLGLELFGAGLASVGVIKYFYPNYKDDNVIE